MKAIVFEKVSVYRIRNEIPRFLPVSGFHKEFHGFIREYSDLFHLDRYRSEICALDGFGAKSYENLQESIEKARKTTAARILYSLGIPNVGRRTAMMICSSFGEDLDRIRHDLFRKASK